MIEKGYHLQFQREFQNVAFVTDKSNNSNGANAASVSVQIIYNNNNESQSRFKTTVNVNTSIDAENTRNAQGTGMYHRLKRTSYPLQ